MKLTIIVNEGYGKVWEASGSVVDIVLALAQAIAEGSGAKLTWCEEGVQHTAFFTGGVCVGYTVEKEGNYAAPKA